ncbi:MAG TPA: glycosyltransferase [Bryobacteraceae bacterium]|jgi:glycosyltransferase involved in cell wall biosynthesis|nr:glycosyltransferase [Bryobacteraceae bacterium]
MPPARAAFLPDTFHEVNGVAHTSRQLEAFARRRQLPLLSIHCGPKPDIIEDGAVRIVQITRGAGRIGLDAHLDYDPFLFRYARRLEAELRNFGADLIHITGPGDMGTLGCYLARRLRLPLVISWHTSLHEYAARRLERLLAFLSPRISRAIAQRVERLALGILGWFYRKAQVILAPNRELMDMLGRLTGKPVFLMERGVDTSLFTPRRRHRTSNTFRIGYVGRLTAEKNVRFLAALDSDLRTLGRQNFELMIVGEGREQSWLYQHLPNAIFTGVLRGDALADAYADMDLFVFPSRTDTFGNVVLEALASGVPAVVTADGGPKFLVQHAQTGFVARNDWEFVSAVNQLMADPRLHDIMRESARAWAVTQSWDSVLEQVFAAYEYCRRVRPLPVAARIQPALE